jgi:hypothetical protein
MVGPGHQEIAEVSPEANKEGRSYSLAQGLAVFTAVLAALGAVINYQGALAFKESLHAKNEAILKKAHATDLWNYYQAVSTKKHIMELALLLAPSSATAEFKDRIQKYEAQKKDLEKKARELDAASEEANRLSERLAAPHRRLEEALTLIEIAIAVASVTALTQKRWLFWVAGASALLGVALWGSALLAR